jgi:hypothetical protein
MSLRVGGTSNVTVAEVCEAETDLANSSSMPDSSAAVCSVPAQDVESLANELNALVAQVQLRKNTTDSLQAQARTAGLSQTESDALGSGLNKYQGADFAREVGLVRNALGSTNAARAVRTYLDLVPKRAASPDRISPDVTRALVMSVGTSATDSPTGRKGVIGRAQANQAADALTNMLPGDYLAVRLSLIKAGQTDRKGANPDVERALILKGVAARRTQFPKITLENLGKYGTVSPAAKDVTDFAAKIHGQNRAFMISNTEVLGLTNPNQALEQRWNDSCGPTTVEMTEADNDPVYSYNLNAAELAHSTNPGMVSLDQALMLTVNSGVPRSRGTAGTGMTLEGALNTVASPMTGRMYTTQGAGSTPAQRTATMDQMEKLLDQGIDVPIRVGWTGGGGHFQLISDVQGAAPNRQFLVSDPWNGQSGWIGETAIANGNTNFFAGNGTLTHIYPSVATP